MSRALRRYNTKKYIQKQVRLYAMCGHSVENPHIFHKKSCWSCDCVGCGNPRRYFGTKTHQEYVKELDDINRLIDEHFDSISDDDLMDNLISAGYEKPESEN